MHTLRHMLGNADDSVLMTIALTWGVPPHMERSALIEQIEAAMLNPERAESVWDALPDEQRQLLQTVLGAKNAQMPSSIFRHMVGEDFRKMGKGAAEKEKPHKHPKSSGEGLYYKGLIAEGFVMTSTGSLGMIYVPEDLALVLPKHKTSYGALETPQANEPLDALDQQSVTGQRVADTSIVDDMTTLMAFVQLHNPPLDSKNLQEDALRDLLPYLLMKGTTRVAFLLAIGIEAGLMSAQDGHVLTQRADARQWLSSTRSAQIETLIQAWLNCELYQELYHIPDLTPERTIGYDPRHARRAILELMKASVPPNEWWDVDEFIDHLQETNPDFQRPNGDYSSWYITDIAGEYLDGFESWDAVEGAQVGFIITGPMHWLGMVDISAEAVKLNAYGRAIVGFAPFPHKNRPDEAIRLEPDGTLFVSRTVPRFDRFQAARFAEWEPAPPIEDNAPFVYRITRGSLQQAAAQDIQPQQVMTFLKRLWGDDTLPPHLEALLNNNRVGDAGAVSLARMIVLRTASSQVLDDILKTPSLRRYLGARLGERAVAVRADQWHDLLLALEQTGLPIDTSQME
jgi:hypothetical protein